MADETTWPGLLDVMHDALAHALNGRVAGLDGIAQLARIRGGLDAELTALLHDELKRLREVAESAVHLPRAARDLGPFTTLKDAVHGVVLVNRIRRNIVIVAKTTSDSAAVRARPDDVVRCLLLLVRSLELRPGAGSSTVVEIAEADDASSARLRLRLADGAAEPDETHVAGAREIARAMGGAVDVSGNGTVELTLPRLAD